MTLIQGENKTSYGTSQGKNGGSTCRSLSAVAIARNKATVYTFEVIATDCKYCHFFSVMMHFEYRLILANSVKSLVG